MSSWQRLREWGVHSGSRIRTLGVDPIAWASARLRISDPCKSNSLFRTLTLCAVCGRQTVMQRTTLKRCTKIKIIWYRKLVSRASPDPRSSIAFVFFGFGCVRYMTLLPLFGLYTYKLYHSCHFVNSCDCQLLSQSNMMMFIDDTCVICIILIATFASACETVNLLAS